MAFQARSTASSQYPGSALPGARLILEADTGLAVGDGLPAPIWRDGSGNGLDLTVAGGGAGATAPTFRASDGDSLPYVQFNGVTNLLGRADAAYAGTVLTLYVVMRPTLALAGTGNPGFVMLGRMNQVTGLAAGTFGLMRDAGSRYVQWLRDTVDETPYALPVGAFVQRGQSWGLYVYSARVVGADLGAGMLAGYNGEYGVRQFGAPGTPAPVWNYTRFGLGGKYIGYGADAPPGASSDFGRVDIRAVALYHLSHTDEEIKTMSRYLAHKWKVPVLD